VCVCVCVLPPDRPEHKRPAVLPRLRHLGGVPHLLGAHPQAADAVGGGHHLPGGRLHPRAAAGPAASQPDGGRADGAVLQRVHGPVGAAEGEHVQVGPEPDVHAAQRRRVHHEPRRQPAHQPGAPRLPQVQHLLRRLGGLPALPGPGPEHAAVFSLPAQRAVSEGWQRLSAGGARRGLAVGPGVRPACPRSQWGLCGGPPAATPRDLLCLDKKKERKKRSTTL